jgi:hypothetical protein
MVDGNCKSCLYFTDFKIMGQCKRYPMYQNRHSTEWCGEYKAAPVAEPTQPTETTVEIFGMEPKKRGRPAKAMQ